MTVPKMLPQKILFGLMALSFASCGLFKKSNENTFSHGKISFMLVDTSGNPLGGEGAGKVIDAMKRWTGVDVEFRYIPTDEYNKKVTEVFEHPSSAPMIMHINKVNQELIQAVNDDFLWDLNEFIWDAEKYPNLSQANKNAATDFLTEWTGLKNLVFLNQKLLKMSTT